MAEQPQEPYDQPQSGQYNQSQPSPYTQPAYGQPQSNPYAQPAYGQPQPNPYTQPTYGRPQSNPYTQPGQRPGQYYAPYYQAQPPRKPKRGLSGGGIAAIVISVIMVPVLLFAAVTIGFMAIAGKAVNDARQQAQVQAEKNAKPPVKYILMKDRPSYQETLDYINNKKDTYYNEISDDTQGFMDKHRIPVTDEGTKYVSDFFAVISTYATNLEVAGDTIGINPDEMDDMIASYRTKTDTVEGHFLKGEPLDVKLTLKFSNGESYTVDDQNSVDLKPLWVDLEPKIAAAPNNMGSSYAESAQKIVELAGMQINWDYNAGNQYCGKSISSNPDMKALEDNETFAYYCPITPNVIYANQSANGWNDNYAPAAAIRHELAHHAIHMRCGTTQPPIVVQNGLNRTEGVTNSYAVKYLGADLALTKEASEQAAQAQHAQYLMNDYTDKAAEAIHNGQCSAVQ